MLCFPTQQQLCQDDLRLPGIFQLSLFLPLNHLRGWAPRFPVLSHGSTHTQGRTPHPPAPVYSRHGHPGAGSSECFSWPCKALRLRAQSPSCSCLMETRALCQQNLRTASTPRPARLVLSPLAPAREPPNRSSAERDVTGGRPGLGWVTGRCGCVSQM